MKHVLTAAAVAFGTMLAVSGAAATSPVLPGSPDIVQVAGGCGPGGHRDRYGYCRPNYRPPPPPAYRGCPPGTHPTPYGCRRNY